MHLHAAIVACLLSGALAFKSQYYNRPRPDVSNKGDSGEPLFLTPYIEKGQFDQAKSLARVGRLQGANVPSYSGYLTVNKTTDSNLFFWFFPAFNNSNNAPTLLWLQGGPGGSSLFGLFVEHGPYKITSNGFAKLRGITWAKLFNIIYIDNPVGTGYSFTKSDAGYVTNEAEVGRDLFEALQQFFTLFSEYANNDFYVTGESYAGKYVPATAYTIHQNRDKAKMKLAGFAIGDPWSDPITQLDYADFAMQIGLADENLATEMRSLQDEAAELIKKGDYIGASDANDKAFNLLMSSNGLNYYYNFLRTNEPKSFQYYNAFVQTPQSRRAIHVGNSTFNDGGTVVQKLAYDEMKSIKSWIAELLNANYKVMIYNGQLDIIVAYPLTNSFVNSIPWNGADEFAEVKRIIWRNPHTGDPAGYVRQWGNFKEVLVRNAGHILPFDQPANAFDMIDRFVNNKPFN